jgi:predicted amidohydrolase
MDLRIGLAQCNLKLGDLEANAAIHEEWIRRARKEKVDLLVFPELSLSGYLLQDMVGDLAMSATDPLFGRLSKAAGDMSLCVGGIEESEGHAQYISSFYLERGQVKHVHRKVYLASYGVFDEARFVGAGSSVVAARTRYGRIGFTICEDSWHPSLVTMLLLDGAQLLVVQTASPVRDLREGEMPQNARTWVDTLRTYARLYGCYIAFCNRVGSEDGLVFWGRSVLLGPDGSELAVGALYDEQLVVGEIDFEKVRQARLSNPILRDEKIELTRRELGRIASARSVAASNPESFEDQEGDE